MMTKDEWVKRMEWVTDYPRSTYRNSWPYNLLYWDGSHWYADCNNLQKALLNGRDVYDPKQNSYQRNLSQTGDCTEWGLLEQCTDISRNFYALKEGEPRILYKDGHIGAYLGKEKTIYKGVVNAVEATPAWEDGIQYSYVGPNGERCSYKGSPVYGYWTHHGKATKWIDYSEPEPEPIPVPTPEPEPEPAPEPEVSPFTDVKVTDSTYKATKWAYDNNIIKGYKDGSFKPDAKCTRVQFITMLWRFAGKPKAAKQEMFNDCKDNGAIDWAVEQGIIKGYKDGTFRPNETLTRSQAAVIIWRLAGKPKPTARTTPFSDVPNTANYANAVIWGSEQGIIKGYKDGTFKPSESCLRRHAVTFLYRLAKIWK